MRINYIGNFGPQFSTENDVLKTLRILGHEVRNIQESPGLSGFSARLTDLVLWSHSHDKAYDFDASALLASDVPTVAFTLDLFRGLARHDPKYVDTHPWFKCKYFFQPDEPEWLRERGVNAFWSPPGILETSCYAAVPNPLHPAFEKIVFVGSRNYHPEWQHRTQLIDWLDKTYGSQFVLFEHSSGMRGHALNELYASAAVVVGDSAFASPDSAYTSDRLFESLGRGANLVYPEIKWGAFPGNDDGIGLRGFLCGYEPEPGNFDSLRDAIDAAWGLAGSDGADVQAQYIRKHHTYTDRIARILEQVTEARNDKQRPGASRGLQ